MVDLARLDTCPQCKGTLSITPTTGTLHRFQCQGGCQQQDIVEQLADQSKEFCEAILTGTIEPDPSPPAREPSHEARHTTTQPGNGLHTGSKAAPASNHLDKNPSTPLRETALEPVFRRVPPQDLFAERAVLCAAFLEARIPDPVAEILTPSDFYGESHREIYKAMLKCGEEPVDAVTVCYYLRQAGVYDAVGGAGYLAELADAVPTARGARRHAEIIQEHAKKRDSIRGLYESMESAYNGVTLTDLAVKIAAAVPVVGQTGLRLPDLTKKDIEPLSWSQMRQRRLKRHREWVVQGKLARGETSSWSGKVEAGKTTIMRELTLAVIRGEPFLGCETTLGRVAYVMLDADGEDTTYDGFAEMGFDDEDDQSCLFIFETMLAQMDKGLERLVKMVCDFKPILVIVDPYPRLTKIEDFHSYTNTYLMGMLSHIAKMADAHLALPGHIPRGRDDDADVATAGFGSIAFSGGVNARFTVINRNGTHTIKSSQGKGAGFEPFDAEYVLQQDEVTKRIRLGGPWSWKDKARSYKERVLEFLDDHSDRPFDVVTLAKEIRVQRSVVRTAANMLFGEQKIRRSGDGLKTDPFIFAGLGYGGPMTMEEVKRG